MLGLPFNLKSRWWPPGRTGYRPGGGVPFLNGVLSLLVGLVVLPGRFSYAVDDSDPLHTASVQEVHSAEAGDRAWREARQSFLRGDFRAAEQAYGRLSSYEPVRAVTGAIKCLRAVGGDQRAAELLHATLDLHPEAARLHALLAELSFDTGNYDQAERSAVSALALEPDLLAARWIQTELHRVRGNLSAASDGYHWFVRYHNTHEITDPDDLRILAVAAAQYARWNRLSDQFTVVVNELLPAARALDADYWPSHLEAARLFLEKFNGADAAREIEAGLSINPHAAELHVARGELSLQNFDLERAQSAAQRALELHPRLLAAHRLLADVHLANLDIEQAIETISSVLPHHLADEELLGHLAASYAVLDGGQTPAPDSRAGKIAAQVEAANAHAGRFYEACGDACELLRCYPLAAHYYARAVERLPQLTAAYGKWGMVLMRLGEEEQARPILKRAFEADPFNLRVDNTLKVLELLAGYETLETPHFRVRFDPRHDRLTARLVAQRLEQVYSRLCKQFEYEPPDKSLFELFSRSRGTDGHGWFSARMVGLPRIHTIGACAGRMVALQSPTDGSRRFNWSRVVEHEFVHILNLQQTNFGVPHWYTEALATLAEGYPRPAEWDRLLARRLAEGRLYTLANLNLGFVRPHNSDDWTLAYCQARLYAEYAQEQFGPDALAKMLALYGRNLATPAVLQAAFSKTVDEFEQGYLEHVQRLVATVPPAQDELRRPPRPLSEIKQALQESPDDIELLAEMSETLRVKHDYALARRYSERALAANVRHPAAVAARFRLHQAEGQQQQAWDLARSAIDPAQPSLELVRLLASSLYKEGQLDDAAKWYALGAEHARHDVRWLKALASVHLKAGDTKRLRPLLEQLAACDPDDLAVRRKLVELALAAGDFAAAAGFAEACLQIDVQDAAAHFALGESWRQLNRPQDALVPLEAAIELRPLDLGYRMARAQALVATGERQQALAAVRDILSREPEYPAARALLERLEP